MDYQDVPLAVRLCFEMDKDFPARAIQLKPGDVLVQTQLQEGECPDLLSSRGGGVTVAHSA